MKTYAFIDASNLFYGGEKSLGWKIDYQKLLDYLKDKYGVSELFYFGGVEIHKFPYNYQIQDTVPVGELEHYLKQLIKNGGEKLNETELLLLGRHLQRVRFYLHLDKFGYKLFLKPVKRYEQEDGIPKRKANCDVDMTLHMMKEKDNYDGAVILSGDGDFLPVLKHLKEQGKQVTVLARSARTAREIKQFAGGNFRDFEYIEKYIRWDK